MPCAVMFNPHPHMYIINHSCGIVTKELILCFIEIDNKSTFILIMILKTPVYEEFLLGV